MHARAGEHAGRDAVVGGRGGSATVVSREEKIMGTRVG
jgi:hypothetical protein